MQSPSISLVKDVNISGSEVFLERTTNLISKLKDKNIPFQVKNNQSYPDGGVISIELHEPVDGIRAGLFHIINDEMHHDPVVQKFTLTAKNENERVLGITFSMHHPDFERALRHEFEKLIA